MDEYDKKIASMLVVIIGLIIVGTVFYHSAEGWRWLDAFYFSATTLTTVGFGDLHPTTDISKIFTVFYILFGVGVLLYSLTLFGSHYIEDHMPNFRKTIFSKLDKEQLMGFLKKSPKKNDYDEDIQLSYSATRAKKMNKGK
ncbi:two pore domain potassium channel family protein [Candidatus Woesearchaeota archaeon]|nr:two pore domain potassium channel family protein [Candidatus Woesearchaeota archaeon]